MQTIKALKAEISRQNKIQENPPKGKNGKIIKSAVTRAKNRVEFLRQCIALLESQPNETDMIETAKRKKDQYDRMYKNYFGGGQELGHSKRYIKIFESESGAGKIKTQWLNLRFLLAL